MMDSAQPEATITDITADYSAFVEVGDGNATIDFLIEGMTCGGCVAKIERTLNAVPDVRAARANLTAGRLHLEWQGPPAQVNDLAARVTSLGFGVAPALVGGKPGSDERELLVALAVAGFAAANVMLLSVSVWAGGSGMDAGTRGLLHWFAALIALPAVAYAGRPFFRTAVRSLRGGHLNMDVPISLAVILAAGMSLLGAIRGDNHVWFDSAITLLFFLLVGRYLDRRARGKAQAAAERVLSLQDTTVTVLVENKPQPMRPDQVQPGMTVLAAAGQRLSVDGMVIDGRSSVDKSLLTGESMPATVGPGGQVFAGTLNIEAPLRIRATATGEGTVLAEIARVMQAAESRRGRFVGLADRVARLYAPVVHLLALLTFVGWWALAGAHWSEALLIAIAVLIITCPCAMGLAVPAVQVVATGRLMRDGTLVKSGDALERLTQIDTVVFDKTGTLTLGQPDLVDQDRIAPEALSLAASIAANSRHPLARALCRAHSGTVAQGVVEVPGNGLSLDHPDGEIRLGKRTWAVGNSRPANSAGMEMWLGGAHAPVQFRFADAPRADARDVIAWLKARQLDVILTSGDRQPAVAAVAAALGIETWHAEFSPVEKHALLEGLRAGGRRVLMVGDGLNDAPALAAAHVSISPATAADISQTAADVVFQSAALAPVRETLAVAYRSNRLIRQNMALSLLYNAGAIPLAVAGLVTPLIAAVCMSASSIVVVLNSLRLARGR
jgi:Cu2+-exporting ATPase